MESDLGLVLGMNALVFYETRQDWNLHPPKDHWKVATSRKAPLGGQFVARIPATTANNENDRKEINLGFTGGKNGRGAGIRLYEYASPPDIDACKLQLEAIFWLCADSLETAIEAGMTERDAKEQQNHVLKLCGENALLDWDQLSDARIIDGERHAICPLCLLPLSGRLFLRRLSQAEGREVDDLTITEVSLFHINELRYGVFNHRPYNLGWGHHDCNVVVKDHGISQTLQWMQDVLNRNRLAGFMVSATDAAMGFEQPLQEVDTGEVFP